MTGPFAKVAEELWRHGLAPIPCPVTNSDGKAPGIRFKGWTTRPRLDRICDWAERFADANVAVLTGLSGVTVVDVDDEALVSDMIHRFGDMGISSIEISCRKRADDDETKREG